MNIKLDGLDARCSEDRTRFADLVAGANRAMADRGARETLLQTLEGIDRAVPSGAGHNCTDLATAYALVRVGGR